MDSLLFFSFLFFFLTMAPQVLEKKIALPFTYRKIVIIFKSVELEHTPSSFPQSKRWSATVQSQKKKKKGSSRRIYSCFFTHNGITTPKTLREGQESTTKTSLHSAWPPKFKNQVLFTPRAQSRLLDLGLLLRGCRPESWSLPGRVEVIQPVVRACTTFWLTSTRITLTRVHRRLGAKSNRYARTQKSVSSLIRFHCSNSCFLLETGIAGHERLLLAKWHPKSEKKLRKRPFFDSSDRHEKLYGRSRLYASAQGRHETGGVLSLFSSLSFDISIKNSMQRWSSDFQGLFCVKIRKMAQGSNDLSTLPLNFPYSRLCLMFWKGEKRWKGRLTIMYRSWSTRTVRHF